MPVLCFKCKKQFLNTGKLSLHLRSFHLLTSHDNFICYQDGCRQSFTLINSLLKHINRYHKNDDVQQLPVDENDDRQPVIENVVNPDDGSDDDISLDEENTDPAGDAEEVSEILDPELMKKDAASFILHMRGTAAATLTSVKKYVDATESLVANNVGVLKHQVIDLLQRNNINLDSDDVQSVLSNFDSVSDPFEGLRTVDQQNKYFNEHCNLVQPETLSLPGSRYDQHLDKSSCTLKQNLVTETYQYISITKTLQAILSSASLRTLIENEQRSQNGFLSGYKDGQQYTEHGMFNGHPNTIRITLYYDDVEVANPLGSKRVIHKLGMFYFSIDNLPKLYNRDMKSIHLLAVCHSLDLGKNGFEAVLRPFKREMVKLESDEGVVLDVKGYGPLCIRAALTAVVGDTLAVHAMFNLLSPSATYFCRQCLCDREMAQVHFIEDEFEMRTIEAHNEHAAEAAGMPRGNSETGVRGHCCLNDLRYFHNVANFNFDVMHDIFEGVGPYEVKLILKQLIVFDKIMTVNDLNERLKSFAYPFTERKNKPPANLTRVGLMNDSDHKLGQKAAQMACLLRMLPFLIGDKVRMGNPYFELLLLLLRCLDIILAVPVHKSHVFYLKHLICEHHTHFKEMFPDNNLINKHHHMTHYATCILKAGPLANASCFKFEAKNGFIKRVGHVNQNFKNISKSVASKMQLHHCATWQSGIESRFECSSGDTVEVGSLEGGQIIQDLQTDVNDVFVAHEIVLFGTAYRPNLYVIIDVLDDDDHAHEPVFGYITSILVGLDGEQEAHFMIRKCTTGDFIPHYHAYTVTIDDPPVYSLVRAIELRDHLPYSALQSFSEHDGNRYISLRYIVY